ncbi:MAG: DUF4358 domain-containing protein [Clostridia bacterium]|nr:DUF4358 domain-containing protein [Clostridia bacterium]
MKLSKIALVLCLLMLCMALTGCGSTQAKIDGMTCAQIAENVQAAASFVALTDVNESYLEKYLWVDAENLEDWVMRRDATRATPEMILVLKVKAGVDVAEIRQAVQDYHDEQTATYRGYQPAQMPKLESASVMVQGQYIVLVVSPDAASVNAALGSGWK